MERFLPMPRSQRKTSLAANASFAAPRAVQRAALAAALLALAGCTGTPRPQIGPVTAIPIEEMGQADYAITDTSRYRLRPADVVSVTVFREADLSLDRVPVSADGTLSLPLLGSMSVAGLTPEEMGGQIRQMLARGYLVDPRVNVTVHEYVSHEVTVEGAVKVPGIYKFRPGTRLSGAIALSEGTVREAKLDQVAVFRNTAQGIAVAKFDYGKMQAGTMIDPILHPGDRVVVGTSTLTTLWQDFLKAMPAFSVFFYK